MNSEVIVYVATKDLKKAGGNRFIHILKDLVDSGIVNSFEELIALKIDKSKALHIEAALEGFYDSPVATKYHKPNKGDK